MLHPLHEKGYQSIGDVQSTVPVPRERWWDYGGERAGRFLGLQNADGSIKTEGGAWLSSRVAFGSPGAYSLLPNPRAASSRFQIACTSSI